MGFIRREERPGLLSKLYACGDKNYGNLNKAIIKDNEITLEVGNTKASYEILENYFKSKKLEIVNDISKKGDICMDYESKKLPKDSKYSGDRLRHVEGTVELQPISPNGETTLKKFIRKLSSNMLTKKIILE
jgi:hypothetical protein